MTELLAFLGGRENAMVDLLSRLAEINSFSHNAAGLSAVADLLQQEFTALRPDRTERIALPPAETLSATAEVLHAPVGDLLSFSKRPAAPLQVLLVIHYDTVYPPEHAFRSVRRDGVDVLRGRGVADAKGGIVVMLNALLALEQSPHAGRIGWHVLLNPDEEIGSPGSAAVLEQAAAAAHLALVFEPAPTATTLVTRRKGSGSFSVVFRGRAAHAGREIERGRNAVLAAARFALEATAGISAIPEATINVSKVDGGGPTNVVPDLAILRFNVRVVAPEQQRLVEARLEELTEAANRQDGITATLHGHFTSPPWVMHERGLALFERLREAGREMGLKLEAQSSGGASDANKIAATGLAVLDSLGPVGSDIHSDQERVSVASLVERARLSAALMLKLASGEVAWPPVPLIP
jgi:glutamate carboxypeptidase